MARFRKKPVMIEAQQVTRDNLFEVATWCNGVAVGVNSPGAGILIDTLEGQMKAALGDWVIRGVQGEFYPCKPDIFEATYDPVEDTETLEAGVVVVPVELAQRLLKRCREQQLEHERLSEQAADTGMFLSAEAFAAAATEAEADADALEAILSRLQQNGGEET